MDDVAQVATALIFDADGKLLIYLRDDKPTIPFPNHWDLFGGFVEAGESVVEALHRELWEELRVKPQDVELFKQYEVDGSRDSRPNVKHVFRVSVRETASDLTLYEGQELRAIDIDNHNQYKFANILGSIVADFAKRRNDF